MRIRAIMKKEFLHILRDVRVLVIMLIMPPVLLILLGYTMVSDVEHLPTAVYDLDKSSYSRGLLEGLEQSRQFDPNHHVFSEQKIVELMDSGEARAAVIIPPDYSKNIVAGRAAEVEVILDGSDPSIARTGLFAAQMVAQLNSTKLIIKKFEKMGMSGGLEMPVNLQTRVWYNPDLKKLNFMIPGLVGVILMYTTIIETAFAIVKEREQGTMEQLIVTPIHPFELMVGKIIPYVGIAFFNAMVTLLLGYFWFGVPIAGSIFLLTVLSAVFVLGSLGIGLLISTLSETQMQAMQTAVFFLLPAFLFSGFLIPIEAIPKAIRWVCYLIPTTYFLQILRGIILKGIGIQYLWKETIILAVFGLAMIALSAWKFRKKLD
ncbi:MAG TPA: ABC transporter permease [Thermoplasmata archaeon]|nr:ABC transporter permease [Thermoplasmata archaeon]